MLGSAIAARSVHAMHHFTAYGLSIRSTLPLPELRPADPTYQQPDVVITQGALPSPPALPAGANYYVRPGKTSAYLAWKGAGTFLVGDGCKIIYDSVSNASPHKTRLLLLGVVLGILLHQRGHFTLHASAVALNDRAVGFIGWKGAGKSTTAAALQARGHTLLTDDVLALTAQSAENEWQVLPSFPQIKLRSDAAEKLGYDPGDLVPLADVPDKRGLHQMHTFAPKPLPLDRLYLLAEGSTVSMDRVSGGEAFAALMSHTYAPRFLKSEASTPEHFDQCRSVAQHVPLYRLIRPKRLDALNAIVAAIECQADAGAATHPET